MWECARGGVKILWYHSGRYPFPFLRTNDIFSRGFSYFLSLENFFLIYSIFLFTVEFKRMQISVHIHSSTWSLCWIYTFTPGQSFVNQCDVSTAGSAIVMSFSFYRPTDWEIFHSLMVTWVPLTLLLFCNDPRLHTP